MANIEDLLKKVVQKSGTTILLEIRLIGVLKDLNPNIETKYLRIFRQIVSDKIIEKINTVTNGFKQFNELEIDSLKFKFKTENGYDESADYIINCILYSVDLIKINDIKPRPDDNNKTSANKKDITDNVKQKRNTTIITRQENIQGQTNKTEANLRVPSLSKPRKPYYTLLYIITFLLVIVGSIFFIFRNSSEELNLPSSLGFVNDFEGTFTASQIKELSEIISQHEQATGNEIAIVTIDSFSPYHDLSDYSLALANYWGIGKKGQDNGVLLIFGKKIRAVRIQVGLGLEDKLTDDIGQMIIDEVIIPEFKKGDYYSGTKKGLMEIMAIIK